MRRNTECQLTVALDEGVVEGVCQLQRHKRSIGIQREVYRKTYCAHDEMCEGDVGTMTEEVKVQLLQTGSIGLASA